METKNGGSIQVSDTTQRQKDSGWDSHLGYEQSIYFLDRCGYSSSFCLSKRETYLFSINFRSIYCDSILEIFQNKN